MWSEPCYWSFTSVYISKELVLNQISSSPDKFSDMKGKYHLLIKYYSLLVE